MATCADSRVVEALLELGFGEPRHVHERASIADLFRPGQRCGIYVLHCCDDEYYAGQAVDIVRRYTQHRLTHEDIVWVSFMPVPRERLDSEERRVIWALESAGVRLRNISLVSVPVGETDFDLIMPVDEQKEWISGSAVDRDSGGRFDDADLRRRYQRKFARLAAMNEYEQILPVLQSYVKQVVPRARAGEVSFWCCSCLPPSGHAGVTLFFRINIYLQEVLTGGRDSEGLFFSFHVASSPLDETYGDHSEQLFEQHQGLCADDHFYPSGGSDQLRLEVGSVGDALALLDDPVIRHAIKVFNLRLMRKGPCLNKANHCLALADAIIAGTRTTTGP